MKNKLLVIIIAVTISCVSFIGGIYTATNDVLGMNKVIGFETNQNSFMLYTNNGGYYWEGEN